MAASNLVSLSGLMDDAKCFARHRSLIAGLGSSPSALVSRVGSLFSPRSA